MNKKTNTTVINNIKTKLAERREARNKLLYSYTIKSIVDAKLGSELFQSDVNTNSINFKNSNT
jgi:hypothetical protein